MLDDIKFLFDLIDRFYKKKTETKEKQNFDKVLTAIYKLRNLRKSGTNTVDIETLQRDAGLKKLDILNAIEAAKEKGWITDTVDLQKIHHLYLKADGALYVEGLLEEVQEKGSR